MLHRREAGSSFSVSVPTLYFGTLQVMQHPLLGNLVLLHSGSLHTYPSALWLLPQHRKFAARSVSLLKCYLFSFYVFFSPCSEDSPGTIPVSAGAE